MLTGKTLVLGVTGSIAAYKMANVASMLVKLNADVHVIMTKNATNFINPIAFETLTGHKCLVDTFDRNFEFNVEHVSLAAKADLFLIAPASANIIGKIACGIADDMLSTTVMAAKCPVLLSPAMNTNMYENPIVQRNLNTLKEYGYHIIEPDSGRLACGTSGAGKLPSEDVLVDNIIYHIAKEKDMAGINVLVTAGPTREAIDPVRFITNHSTGKMGYAIARMATLRGANVTLVSGPVNIAPPSHCNVVNIESANDMYREVRKISDACDIIIKCAAVADYRPAVIQSEKIKKSEGEASLMLERTNDILKYLGEHKKDGQLICGFSMETENVIENSRAKLTKKNADMIAANSIKDEGAGFGHETNRITLITRESEKSLPLMSKTKAADIILDELMNMRNAQS